MNSHPTTDSLCCFRCGSIIKIDGDVHDQCILINDGTDLVCPDCIREEDYEDDDEDDDEDEDEDGDDDNDE